jgi:hypothetical protein
MSTPDYDDDDFLGDDAPQQQGPRQLREAMRRAQEQATEAAARAEAAERRAVFAEAGLTTLTPAQRTLLDAGYKGDLTAEAVRAFATEAGFIAPPPAPEPDASAQAQARIADAAGTATAVPTADAKVSELHAAAAQGRDALLAKMREHGANVGNLPG